METALGNLPDNVAELRKAWQSINSVRNSGLVSVHDGEPLDGAVRNGEWDATLQQRMPTAGGLPGSRGILQNWPHYNTDNYYAHIFANHFAEAPPKNGGATEPAPRVCRSSSGGDAALNGGYANNAAHTPANNTAATTQMAT